MAKSTMRKEVKKNKQIDELRQELMRNDERLRKNTEEFKLQVQLQLYGRGYPKDGLFYDHHLAIEKLKVKESELKIKSGFSVLAPYFTYETDNDWQQLQIEFEKEDLRQRKDNIQEIEKNVEEVKNDITEQNERIKARRTQILDILKSKGADISDFSQKPPEYIN